MGTALAFAITQSTAIALSVFAALGLGLGLPFLILTMAPSLIERLPAPGQWMQSLREFLAFPLYITVVWLIWIISNQSGSNAAALVLIGSIFIAMGIWLWGQHPVKRLVSITCFALSASIIVSPILNIKQSISEKLTFDPTAIDRALADGHPVFVNITADWCITCLVNERNTLSSEEIKALFADKQIVYIKGDWTKPSDNINQYLASFNRNGVPLYVAYTSQGQQILPQILTNNTIKQAFSQEDSK
jgi:thiol:disulfide interchange protein DsbD